MDNTRLLVIGGVAAGTKAASRAKRLNPALQVTIITEESDISYAGCGLPYYVGDIIKERRELAVRTPEEFKELQGIDVMVRHRVDEIDAKRQTLRVTSLDYQTTSEVSYDKLVIATGSTSVKPPIPGIDLDRVYELRSIPDADAIKVLASSYAVPTSQTSPSNQPQAVIVGGGLIGLEAAENLVRQGFCVTVLEREPHILGFLDTEVSLLIQQHLEEQGVKIMVGQGVTSIEKVQQNSGDDSGTNEPNAALTIRTSQSSYPASFVLWATGARPNSKLAAAAGAEIGPKGGIKVDSQMRTNLPNVWAAGDCCETVAINFDKPIWVAMGSVANKMGRVAGTNVSGSGFTDEFHGVSGTAIIKLFDISVGKTGLSEREARAEGFDIISVIVPTQDRAHYYPGHKTVTLKLIVNNTDGRLLGAQVWGYGVVDKPLDILAASLAMRARVDDLANMDLAYAPPFSMAMGSVIAAANVARNKLAGVAQGVGPVQLKDHLRDGLVTVLDVRTEPEHMIRAIPDSINIPFEELEARLDEIPTDKPIVTVCRVGRRAYLAGLALKAKGITDVRYLDGGTESYPYEMI